MIAEQYAWKITLQYSLPGGPFPFMADYTVQVGAAQTPEEASECAITLLKMSFHDARAIESVSVLPIWHPDFRKDSKSGLWYMLDRERVRRGEDPWVPLPGRPALALRSTERHAGFTFYVTKETPKGARL